MGYKTSFTFSALTAIGAGALYFVGKEPRFYNAEIESGSKGLIYANLLLCAIYAGVGISQLIKSRKAKKKDLNNNNLESVVIEDIKKGKQK